MGDGPNIFSAQGLVEGDKRAFQGGFDVDQIILFVKVKEILNNSKKCNQNTGAS